MKMKFVAVAIGMLALLLCGSVMLSYAQGPEDHSMHMMGGHEHGHMGMIFRELNLTDVQKQQAKGMIKATHANMLTAEQQLAQNRIAMLQATANGAFDQAKIQTLANQRAQLEAQMMMQHEALASQIYNQVLTADQRTKADQLRADEISHIQQHMQDMANAPAAPPTE